MTTSPTDFYCGAEGSILNGPVEKQIVQDPKLPIPNFAPFEYLAYEITAHILSFLEERDLRVVDCVSHIFRRIIESACEIRYRIRIEKFVPEFLPAEVNYKQFLFFDRYRRFPHAIGVEFYEEYFGEVDIIPVPESFLAMAPRPGFKLVFIPEFITIKVDENSRLILDETIALNGKKARLIEASSPQGQARKIKVPVTPNNIILMVQQCLKKNFSLKFAGIARDCWASVLDQNGDIGVGPSYWSYQKEGVIGLGKSYSSQGNQKNQEEIARDEGLEIMPLAPLILFHLSSYIKSGKCPPNAYFVRTSTVTQNSVGTSLQSTLWWKKFGSVLLLGLYSCNDDSDVGAAAWVPVGSFQAIAH